MKRDYSIDLIRVVCCIIVVMGHVLTVAIHQSPVPVEETIRVVIEQGLVFLRWVIPVFVMITGYCIALKKTCTYSYCIAHVLRFVSVLFTVGLFFALLEIVYSEGTFNGSTIIKAIGNVISGKLWDHMYFVYIIIGIYLVLPVIHSFWQQDQKSIITFTVLMFVLNILLSYLDKWFHVKIRLPFDNFLLYVFFGGAVAKIGTKKEWRWLYLGILLLCMVYMVIFSKTDNWGTGTHPAVCLMGMCIFLLMKEIDVKPSKLLLQLSGLTWGVYLIHPLYINIAMKVLRINLGGPMAAVKIIVSFCIICVISFVTTFLLKKIPLINKLL